MRSLHLRRTASRHDDERREVMGDQLDVPLEDSELLEEVEMVSALILAASENDGQLDNAEIDRLLGVPDEDPAGDNRQK